MCASGNASDGHGEEGGGAEIKFRQSPLCKYFRSSPEYVLQFTR